MNPIPQFIEQVMGELRLILDRDVFLDDGGATEIPPCGAEVFIDTIRFQGGNRDEFHVKLHGRVEIYNDEQCSMPSMGELLFLAHQYTERHPVPFNIEWGLTEDVDGGLHSLDFWVTTTLLPYTPQHGNGDTIEAVEWTATKQND